MAAALLSSQDCKPWQADCSVNTCQAVDNEESKTLLTSATHGLHAEDLALQHVIKLAAVSCSKSATTWGSDFV